MAEIISIVIKRQREERNPPAFERESVQAAALVAGYGIEGDRKGGNPKRQLNIISHEAAQSLQADGYRTEPGMLGEQIVVRGLAVETMAPGDRIRLGDEAIIEVTSLREPCERFEAAQNRSLEGAVGRVGVMARVIAGGDIRVGDLVAVADPVA